MYIGIFVYLFIFSLWFPLLSVILQFPERHHVNLPGGRLIFGKTFNSPREILVWWNTYFNRLECRDFTWLQDTQAEESHGSLRRVRFFSRSAGTQNLVCLGSVQGFLNFTPQIIQIILWRCCCALRKSENLLFQTTLKELAGKIQRSPYPCEKNI